MEEGQALGALDSGDQFRPPAPPALDGAVWKRDYEEVRAIGGKSSPGRTDSQTEAARFWTMTGPAAQLPVVRALAANAGRILDQNARLLALASMVLADSDIAVFDAKYEYLFWRPITAIRNGGGTHEQLPDEATREPHHQRERLLLLHHATPSKAAARPRPWPPPSGSWSAGSTATSATRCTWRWWAPSSARR